MIKTIILLVALFAISASFGAPTSYTFKGSFSNTTLFTVYLNNASGDATVTFYPNNQTTLNATVYITITTPETIQNLTFYGLGAANTNDHSISYALNVSEAVITGETFVFNVTLTLDENQSAGLQQLFTVAANTTATQNFYIVANNTIGDAFTRAQLVYQDNSATTTNSTTTGATTTGATTATTTGATTATTTDTTTTATTTGATTTTTGATTATTTDTTTATTTTTGDDTTGETTGDSSTITKLTAVTGLLLTFALLF